MPLSEHRSCAMRTSSFCSACAPCHTLHPDAIDGVGGMRSHLDKLRVDRLCLPIHCVWLHQGRNEKLCESIQSLWTQLDEAVLGARVGLPL